MPYREETGNARVKVWHSTSLDYVADGCQEAVSHEVRPCAPRPSAQTQRLLGGTETRL